MRDFVALKSTSMKVKGKALEDEETLVEKTPSPIAVKEGKRKKKGGGLMMKKKFIKPRTQGIDCQLVFWNSLDELIQRLELLHASLAAGNQSVISEIANIEAELREEGVIC